MLLSHHAFVTKLCSEDLSIYEGGDSLKNNLKRSLYSLLASSLVVLAQVIVFKIKFSYLENNADTFKLTFVESLIYNMGDGIWIYHGVIFVVTFIYVFSIIKKTNRGF